MIQTPDEARKELERLGLPGIFERISHRDNPMALVGTCEPVKRYYQLLPELSNTHQHAKHMSHCGKQTLKQ